MRVAGSRRSPHTLAAPAICHAAPENGDRSPRSDPVKYHSPERFHTVWLVFDGGRGGARLSALHHCSTGRPVNAEGTMPTKAPRTKAATLSRALSRRAALRSPLLGNPGQN